MTHVIWWNKSLIKSFLNIFPLFSDFVLFSLSFLLYFYFSLSFIFVLCFSFSLYVFSFFLLPLCVFFFTVCQNLKRKREKRFKLNKRPKYPISWQSYQLAHINWWDILVFYQIFIQILSLSFQSFLSLPF